MSTQYAYRNQKSLAQAIGLSVKELADFTPTGCVRIIEQLEAVSENNPAIKALLTAERRGYCALYYPANVIPFPALKPIERSPRHDSEIVLEFRAKRAFGG